jgi:hypothetical protein
VWGTLIIPFFEKKKWKREKVKNEKSGKTEKIKKKLRKTRKTGELAKKWKISNGQIAQVHFTPFSVQRIPGSPKNTKFRLSRWARFSEKTTCHRNAHFRSFLTNHKAHQKIQIPRREWSNCEFPAFYPNGKYPRSCCTLSREKCEKRQKQPFFAVFDVFPVFSCFFRFLKSCENFKKLQKTSFFAFFHEKCVFSCFSARVPYISLAKSAQNYLFLTNL